LFIIYAIDRLLGLFIAYILPFFCFFKRRKIRKKLEKDSFFAKKRCFCAKNEQISIILNQLKIDILDKFEF